MWLTVVHFSAAALLFLSATMAAERVPRILFASAGIAQLVLAIARVI